MKKTNENKGFTMAELLIVVAIIAVMVAIAIPTFANQLERSRESVDLSALRNGYTEAKMAMMTAPKDVEFFIYQMPIKQQVKDWTIDLSEFPDIGADAAVDVFSDAVAATNEDPAQPAAPLNKFAEASKDAPNVLATGTEVADIVFVFDRGEGASKLKGIVALQASGEGKGTSAATLLPKRAGTDEEPLMKGTSSYGEEYAIKTTAGKVEAAA